MTLGQLAWRSLAARPLRTGLTVLGVALGVATLLAVLALDSGTRSAAQMAAQSRLGNADLELVALEERGFSPGAGAVLAGIPGVADVGPIFQRRTYLLPTPGTPITRPTDPVTVLGVDPVVEDRLHPWPLTAGVGLGTALGQAGSGAALVSTTLAQAEGLTVGSRFTLLGAAAAPAPLVVVGILAGDGPPIADDPRLVLVPLDQAAGLLGPAGITRIDLRLGPGADPARVTDEIRARFTGGPYVLQSREDLAHSLAASTTDVRHWAILVGTLTLFVAGFLIVNTLAMTVSERVREIGLLRAAGATRRQVWRLVLSGGAAVGLLGGVAGLPLGMVLAVGLAWAARGVLPGPAGVLLTPADVVVGLLVGFAVAVLAALEPALRATRIGPLDALREGNDPLWRERIRVRWLTVVGLAVALVAVLITPDPDPVAMIRGLTIYLGLLALVVALPLVVGPATSLLTALPVRPLRAELRLARGSIARDPSRAVVTVGALAVGVAAVVALGTVAGSVRGIGTAWLSTVLPGDEILTSVRPIPLDEGTVDLLRRLPGVLRVTPFAAFEGDLSGRRVALVATVGADLLADDRLEVVAGDRRAALEGLDAGGGAIVPRSLAEALGLAPGANLSLVTGDGRRDLRVLAVAARTIPAAAGEAILVGWGDAPALGALGADFFVVRLDPQHPMAAKDELEATARGLALTPHTLAAVRSTLDDALGRVFALYDGLAVVALLVACLGIANTVAMSVLERGREIGLLRALGMTRRQVWRMVVVEAAILATVAGLLGAIGGAMVGAAVVVLAGGLRLGLPLVPAWPHLAGALLLALAAALLAAAYPARQAARRPPVEVLRAR
jgi:putative ABC transport system permease protein